MSKDLYPVKPHIQANAHIASREQYDALYKRSLENPEAFWGEQAMALDWFHPWTTVFDADYEEVDFAWFSGGRLNACYNCVDRHLEKRGEQTAILWAAERFPWRLLAPALALLLALEPLYKDVRFSMLLGGEDTRIAALSWLKARHPATGKVMAPDSKALKWGRPDLESHYEFLSMNNRRVRIHAAPYLVISESPTGYSPWDPETRAFIERVAPTHRARRQASPEDNATRSQASHEVEQGDEKGRCVNSQISPPPREVVLIRATARPRQSLPAFDRQAAAGNPNSQKVLFRDVWKLEGI